MGDQAKLVTSQTLGLALCELLHVDPKDVTRISVSAGVNEVASVKVERLVRSPDGKLTPKGKFVETLTKCYELVEKPRAKVVGEIGITEKEHG